MTRSLSALAVALVLASPCGAQAPRRGAPWVGFGPVDSAYMLSTDTSIAYSGRTSLLLQALPGADSTTFAYSQQIVDARPYRSRRVRIEGWLRTWSASAAGLWVVVDGVADGRPATLHAERLAPAVQGTNPWRLVSLVVDVDSGARCIRFGSELRGVGAVWLDAVAVDTVPPSVAATAPATTPEPRGEPGTPVRTCEGLLPSPADLDFEESP
jgi:hypothetical protein